MQSLPASASSEAKRAAPRLKVFLPASMVSATERLRIHLIDLSATGALVHLTATIAPETRVAVEVAGQAIQAKIVWVRLPRCGIVFSRKLSDPELEAIIGGGTVTASRY